MDRVTEMLWDRCTEIEKLERDEFVIDINRRDQVNEEAEKEDKIEKWN